MDIRHASATRSRQLRPAVVLAALLASAPAWPDVARAADGHESHAEPAGSKDAALPPPPGARVYFIDLKDGARVPLKLLVRFGLSNMGVSPAGLAPPNPAYQTYAETGHHHIIVDAPLPPSDRPIPADDNHIHFGGGQTEAEITLTPGPHTLQLLMGDADHVPSDPPVASPVIHVTAAEPRPSAPAGATVAFIGLRDGQRVSDPVRLYFGVQGMGVAPASSDAPNTGHFLLLVDADVPDPDAAMPKDEKHRSFPDGATQTELRLEPGRHTLQLVFADAHDQGFDPPLTSKRVAVTVRRR